MLSGIFSPRHIKLDLESSTKIDAFGEIIDTLTEADPNFNRQELLEAIIMRENKMNTVILPGIAVPHGYINTIQGIVGAIGLSRTGIEYGSGNSNPVHLFLMLFMDETSREKHLQVFSRLLEMLNSTSYEEIVKLGTPEKLYELISPY